MNDAIQPEELTELLDDDLEMWAMGGTRILPKSALTPVAPPLQSYPPVAYAPSIPPPAAKSSAPVWAAVIGMTSVFAISAIAGVVVLALHHTGASSVQASVPPQSIATATTTQDTPPQTLMTTSDTTTPTVTVNTKSSTPHAVAIAPITPVVVPATPKGSGTLQTFAAGNGKPIFVDGKQVGVGGSHVKTACGKHSVVVGSGKARMVDIPCSGVAITVGTPDGT